MKKKTGIGFGCGLGLLLLAGYAEAEAQRFIDYRRVIPSQVADSEAREKDASVKTSAEKGSGFYGYDLAVEGEAYELQLPGAGQYEVSWGDGAMERVTGDKAGHIYKQTGVFDISVKRMTGSQSGEPVPVDYKLKIAETPKVCLIEGSVTTGKALQADTPLTMKADSFSAECRAVLDEPEANQVLMASKEQEPGAFRFGIRNKELYFELNASGVFSVPTDGRLLAGKQHHLAVMYDRVPLFPKGNRVNIFIDGLPVGSGCIDTPDSGAVRCAATVLGGKDFKGQLTHAAVYGELLQPLAILEHARMMNSREKLQITVAKPGSAPVKVATPVIVETVELQLDSDPAADNGGTLRKALAAAKDGTRLRIVGKDGKGGIFYIRSLVGHPHWAGIIVENKKDFELDGNGSTFVFSDNMARYMLIQKCERVAFRNFSFDLNPDYARPGMYAKLLSLDPATGMAKAQLIDGRGQPINVPRRASYWRWRPHRPDNLRLTGKGEAEGAYFKVDDLTEAPKPDPSGEKGVIIFKFKDKPDSKRWQNLKNYMAGFNFYQINNGDFKSNAVSLDNCDDVTFERVNYYATLGMVFLSSGISRLHITDCRIGIPPGMTAADRPLSAGADGYHFHLMRGGILFENNEITLTDDDPVSIKDSIWPWIKKVGPNQIKAGKELRKSATVEFLNADYSPTGFTAVITDVEKEIVTLDRNLPDDINPVFMMNRSRNTNNWILRNNYFHDYYGRVMLYTDHGTVTGNRVHDSYYHLGNSTAYFEHAGASRNVITHRNLFVNTNADSSNWGGNQELPSFHELTYSANSFLGNGLKLNNAADSQVARNWFTSKKSEPTLTVNRCPDVKILDNVSAIPGEEEFPLKSTNTSNAQISGNQNLTR